MAGNTCREISGYDDRRLATHGAERSPGDPGPRSLVLMCDVGANVQIVCATADRQWWVAPASELLERACGSGYITHDELSSLAAADDSAILIAHGSAGLLGLVIVAVADRDVRAQLTRSLSVLGSAGNLPDEPVGWLRAIVVDPAARGQGIGGWSVRAGLEVLRQKRCRTVYAASWISGSGQQSDGILTRNGFDSLGVIANYWSEVADYQGSCAVCGEPCQCSAIVMRRTSCSEPATQSISDGGIPHSVDRSQSAARDDAPM